MQGRDSERIVEQNVVVPVLQIRKEIGEVTEVIPKERFPECIVEQIIDDYIPHRRTRDSHAKGVRWKEAGIHNEDGSDLGYEDEMNKFEELKVFIVVEGDAEYNKKS